MFNAIGRIATIGSALVLTPFILSALGDERFGIWALVTLVMSYITLVDCGVSSAYSKYIAEYHTKNALDKINGVIVCGIGIYLFISIVVVATGHFLIPLTSQIFNIPIALQEEAQTVFWIALIVFAVASIFNVFEAVPVGLQSMEYNNLVQFLTIMLYTAASIVYLRAGGNLVGLMLIRASTIALQIVLMYFISFMLLPSLSLSLRFLTIEQAKTLVIFGLKVQAARFASIGTLNINRVLIGCFVGLLGVTSYQIGFTFVQGIREISLLTFSAMTPLASQIAAKNRREDLSLLYHKGSRVSLLITGAGFGLIAATADPIIVLWTGKHYPVAVIVLVILAFANYVHISTGTGTALARGIGKPGLETVFGTILLLLNSFLGWIFGRSWGIEGILAATIIAYTLSSFIFLRQFNRLIGSPNVAYFRSIVLPPTVAMFMGLGMVKILDELWLLVSSSTESLSRIDALIKFLLNGSEFAFFYFLGLIMLGYIRHHHIRFMVELLGYYGLFRTLDRARVNKSK